MALAGSQKVDFLCAVYLSADDLHCVLLSSRLLHALAADRETSVAQQTITLKVDFVVLKEKRILKKGLFFKLYDIFRSRENILLFLNLSLHQHKNLVDITIKSNNLIVYYKITKEDVEVCT